MYFKVFDRTFHSRKVGIFYSGDHAALSILQYSITAAVLYRNFCLRGPTVRVLVTVGIANRNYTNSTLVLASTLNYS